MRLTRAQKAARVRRSRILALPPDRRTDEDNRFLAAYESQDNDLPGMVDGGRPSVAPTGFGGGDLPGMTP